MIIYYLNKLLLHVKENYSIRRLTRFGIRVALCSTIIFLGHRKTYKWVSIVETYRSRLVEAYIYRHYIDVIQKYEFGE